MSFEATSLHAVLEAHTPSAATGLVVAVSGGADSASLLAALKQPGVPAFRNLPLRAVHIDHALQPEAADFRRACENLCRLLAVPLDIVVVRVEVRRGESLEAAARDARYQGFARQLALGECLLTAHHAEDQAETVLLQLLRGAGLKGLGAMPICRPWAAGWHLRPLLSVAQRELTEFGRAALGRAALGRAAPGRAAPGRAAPGRAEFGPAEGVTAVSDPMNADLRFDRVYLRRQLWPLLEQRWPGAAAALSRTARHCADAQELLDESAAHAVQKLRNGSALSVTGLRALSPAQRDLALRFWLAEQSIDAPGSARLREAVRQMIAAQADHLPAVVWARHALRRYRDRVFLTAAELPRIGQAREWPIAPGAALELGGGLGTLRWSPQDGGLDARRLPPALVMRQRRGGERLRPQPRARTQTLQHLCQAMGVLPWMRDALPLLYAGNELIAVGDLWQDARWCVAAGQPGFGCEWLGGPLLM